MRKSLFSILIVSLLSIAMPSFAQTGNDQRPYDVTVVFLGLVSFDLGDNYQPYDPITVIIPNLTKGAKLQKNTAKIPKHVSYLLADRDAMPESDPINRDYDFEETAHQSDNFVYLPFNGFHISVDDENDVAALNDRKLVVDNSGCKKCPDNDANGKSTNGKLCWLSAMQTVKENPQDRDEAHFSRRAPKLTRDKVAGRIVLRYGTLAAYVVGFTGDSGRNEAPIFDFKRADNSLILYQALAQEVHWTFRAQGLPFVFNLESIKPGGANERVAFIPTFPDQDVRHPGKLTIIIGNTTPDEAGPLETQATPTADMHYAAYYRFIKKNTDGDGPLPTPEMDGGKFVTCTYNINDPILQTLLAEQIQHGTAIGSVMPRPLRFGAKKTKLPKAGHQMGMADGPQPSPGGLNCAPNVWP
jgi:hypothetical protein